MVAQADKPGSTAVGSSTSGRNTAGFGGGSRHPGFPLPPMPSLLCLDEGLSEAPSGLAFRHPPSGPRAEAWAAGPQPPAWATAELITLIPTARPEATEP